MRLVRFKTNRNERGIALIAVVIIMLTIALIGASLIELVASVNLSAQNVLDETKARYLAEAGIAQAIHVLRFSAEGGAMDKKIGPIRLGEGSFTVTFDFSQSLITSTGTVNGVTKKLQLQYNVY